MADPAPRPAPAAMSPPTPIDPTVRRQALSATVGMHQRCAELVAAGRRIYRLGFGQSPFPVPASVVEALRADAHRKAYLPVPGLAELRRAAAEFHRRSHGLACEEDDVVVGPGSKELMFLLQLVYRGEVLVPTPAWVSYEPQLHLLGRTARRLPTRFEDGWRLTAEGLHQACVASTPGAEPAPRLLILNYPGNPTGTSYDAAQLTRLAEVARRHRLLILADEIYGLLHHRGDQPSLATLYPEGTVLSTGLSKWCGAGGWRLGLFLFPPGLRSLRTALVTAASETFTSTSAPVQYAAVRAYQDSADLERYRTGCRAVLGALGQHLAARLRAAGVTVAEPDGGFYLFPDFAARRETLAARGILGSHPLCERLLEETGVALLPGSHFGRPEEELTARLAYVDFDGARALEAALEAILGTSGTELDEGWLRRWCAPTLEGVDRLVDWLQPAS